MKRYIGIRVRNPALFRKSSLRTQDIGRKGHTSRIGGVLKKTGRWATQSYRVLKSDVKKASGIKKTRLGKSLKKRGRIARKGIDYQFRPY